VILSVVRRSHSHPTAEEVYSEAKAVLPSLSLGTVYRNLRLLAGDGQIREVLLGGSSARFDGTIEDHEHFICTNCSKITDIEPTISTPKSESLERQIPDSVVSTYKLTYFGLCPDCSKLRK
jgi:Fe2+ or Zn2+ uptake regulation protein